MEEQPTRERRRMPFTAGLIVKYAALTLIDGLVLRFALPKLLGSEAWVTMAFSLAALFLLNWIYLSPRRMPGKYLYPATAMLAIFSVWPVVYTIYVSFTNYSAAHNLTRDQAIEQILRNSEKPSPDAPKYQAIPLEEIGGDAIAMLLTDQEGRQYVGTEESLEPVSPDQVQGSIGQITVDDFGQVGLLEVQERQDEFLDLRVPTEGGSIRLQTVSTAALVRQTLGYDEEAGTMTDLQTGAVYRPVEGTFKAEDGSTLTPGWRVPIGFDNYVHIFTSSAVRGPFARVFVWNYVFAISAVVTQFALGLLIAIALFHSGLRARRAYRSLLIIPYALPSYLTALIWAGLLNQQFGAVNNILGADIPWLRDPYWAKASIIMVTLWLGFPYFFLVSTGALTSIPAELMEAAAVDGASGWYAFRKVRFPLLLTALGPLLISSFAFNFNNFNVIFLLTGGGPPIEGAQTPAGHTDLLITYTYRLAFQAGQGANYALAAAVSMIIFVMILTITALSFRYTRALEQVS